MSKICEVNGKCDLKKDTATINCDSGNNNFQNTRTNLSSAFRHISLFTIAIALFVFMLLVSLSPVFAMQDLMALQGNVNDNGLPIALGNLTVTIWNQPTGGSLIYSSSSDYTNVIVAGKFDIMLGDGSQELVLEYGKTYYMDMSVNGQDLDFNGSERRIFKSNVGNVSGNYIFANTINTTQITDSAITNQKISASAAIDKSKISTSGTWTETDIPSLTNSWLGILNASRIVSSNLLNVNSSVYAQYVGTFDATAISLKLNTSIFNSENTSIWSAINNKLGITDQRFNESSRIDSLNNTKLAITDQRYNETALINSKLDITDQRFNDTALVGSKLTATATTCFVGNYSRFNGTGFECSSDLFGSPGTTYTATAPGLILTGSAFSLNETYVNSRWNDTLLINGVNSTSNIQGLGFNTTAQLNSLYIGLTDQRFNSTSRIDLLNSTKLDSTDQRFNDSARIVGVNSSSNIQSLGFNTTSQLDSRFYSLSNPSGFVNSSGLSAYNDSARIDLLNSTKLDSTDQRYNNTARIDSLNSTKLDLTDQRYNATVRIDSLNSTKLDLTDQRFNESTKIAGVNSSSNIQSLGFNTTVQLDNRYYSLSNPSGFVNSSGLSVYNDTARIVGVNSSVNIQGLGFNTTSQLDVRYYYASNPTNFINSSIINSIFGNWSSDKSSYNTTSQLNSLYLSITDQRFNSTSRIDLLNSTKLDSTDQRYNNTVRIDLLNSTKLDLTDQRYNNTARIDSLNSTKLDLTDQRYNNTVRIDLLNSTKLDSTDQKFNDSSRLDLLNLSKLNITDQRFNDTTAINNVNSSANIQSLGFNTTAQLDNRFIHVNDEINVTTINATNNPTSGQTLTYAGTNDQFTWVNTPVFDYNTALIQTTSNTAYSLISDLSFNLQNASTYIVSCSFLTYSAAVTTGNQFRINTTGSPTKITWSLNTQVTATSRTSFQGVSTTSNTFAPTGSAGTNIRDITLLQGYIVTAASPSNVTYEMRSEISASNAAFDIGSYCQYVKVG